MSSANGDDPYAFSGLNPWNWPHRIQQYRTNDPDGTDPRDVQDPHTWEDPDPSLRARITPNTVAGWMVAAVVFLAAGGLTFYLFPVFAPAFRNEALLVGITVVAFLVLFHLWSRQRGVEAVANMDKSIINYGDEADVRLGEYQGTTGRSELFTPYVDLTYAAFSARPLKKRDLPFPASRLRSNIGRTDAVGEEPAIDRLNHHTVEVTTETMGRVFVTHGEGMEFDGFGRESDRYVTPPNTIDEDVARQMNELIESLEASIQTLRQQRTMLEERIGDIRDTKQTAVVDELSGAINLMEKMTDLAAKQQYPQQHQAGDQTNGSLSNGTGPVADLEREVAEEVGED